MNGEHHQHVARVLLAAYDSGPTEPPSDQHDDMTVDDGYAIQRAQVTHQQQAGRRVVGFKVGLTSAAMRRALGVDQPDFGHLLEDMAIADGGQLPAGRLLQPRAEPEIAFVLADTLAGPGVTASDVRAATATVAPALEIIDSRIAGWRITLADTVADNGSSGLFVLGPHRPLAGLDLGGLRCALLRDGEVLETGQGSAVLGDPAEAVAWLANELGRRGTTLTASQVILSGSCTAAYPIQPGQTVQAHFDILGSATATMQPLPAEVGVR